MPRVSVIITSHERATYLRAAIESVFAQDMDDIELIVVDTGSIATRSVLDAYRDRLRVVELPTARRSEARNEGVAVSRADLVAFLDDDDVWTPGKLTRQLSELDGRPEVVLIHAFTDVIGPDGKVIDALSRERLAQHRRADTQGYGYLAMSRSCIVFTSTVVIRKSAFLAAGGYDHALDAYEDWDLYLRLASRGEIACIPEVLTHYRVHASQSSADALSTGRIATARKQLALIRSGSIRSAGRAERAALEAQIASAHYLRGEHPRFREHAKLALRADPRLVFSTRLAPHLVRSFLFPGGQRS